ncbi:neuraminidase-like domain-containing protein [Dictyobacter aurantiacus]|uniref:Uncharacterized protein n=1 Tax=Dictyobacter aurantiacus TaxID=1936993 RepID=A0A401ZIZ7_9CHLR|nr:neuraminidase-like domain-containing protein [Dictyobacter aurantiacus]GCE06809.1 hypothetical protein KDAU_41380 [Dictyobacter aurantiacus]
MSSYLVARLTPSSPVDGATFAAYLDDLHIQVLPANPLPGTTPLPLGSAVYASPLLLLPDPGGSPAYLGIVSKLTSAPTAQVGPNDYGTVLEFDSTEGIAVGSWLFSAEANAPFAPGLTVIEVHEQSITLSGSLPAYVPAGTVASFVVDYENVAPWSTHPPQLSFERKTSSAIAKGATVLPLASTRGITVEMTVSTSTGALDTGTTVLSANETSVTLSRPTSDKLSKNTAVTFTFALSSGITQHVDPNGIPLPGFAFLGYNPQAVATAIIELSSPPPAYLDVSIVASRHGIQIPIDTTFYDVLVSSGSLPTPDQYQDIPSSATSFYLTLPAPPANSNAVNLTLAGNGTPPPFHQLFAAVQSVLSATPGGSTDLATLTEAQCRKIAYEIVWSQQKPLPTVPDPQDRPLESLYTNPPNNGALLNGKDPNKNEGDRQQFEGDLQAYYARPNAQAERLVGYVYALSAAFACFALSQQATTMRFQFPIIVEPAKAPAAGIDQGAVLLTNGNAPMTPSFAVPVEYFYALGVGLPAQVTPQQQYQMACLASEQQILTKIQQAIDAGAISAPVLPSSPPNPEDPNAPTITPQQAVRQLNALGVISSKTDPACAINSDDLPALIGSWLAIAGDDIAIANFWHTAVTTYKSGYLDLVLCAVSGGHMPLIDAIKASWEYFDGTALQTVTVATVEDLTQVTAKQWHDLFIPPPQLPGSPPPRLELFPSFIVATRTPDERVTAFVHQLQNFFTVSSGVAEPSHPALGAPPTFAQHPGDPLLSFMSNYGALAFGPNFPSQPAFQNALDSTFQHDEAAKAWMTQLLETINALYILTDTGIPKAAQPGDPDLRFSVMEALYARGFTSIQGVQSLTEADFQHALTATVAYSYAHQIYANAQAATQPGGQDGSGFQPINPDGCLVNCVPPLYLSPLGPVAYLHDLLKVSATSTCENPLPEDVEQTLENMLALRRGSLGALQVTEANLETPLPLIDIVNECLEAITAQVPLASPPAGVIYNTASDKLDEHKLCTDEDDTDEKHSPDRHHKHAEACHNPARLFEAVPQYSSPATPVAQPGAYEKLKSDFSSCHLPYAQSLDISRSYLRRLGTSRYAVMRRFRKDITEFVLDPSPAHEPSGFQRHLWRYPVRIEIAREYLGISPEEYDLLFTQDIATMATSEGDQLLLWQVYGYPSETVGDTSWEQLVVQLPEFLKRTCLTYCEFLELWRSGFVKFQCSHGRREGEGGAFPDCEPCCLDQYSIQFEDPEAPEEALKRLVVFIRLWRKLQQVKNARYSFARLCDICTVLNLFNSGSINPDFIRQLAAFQMLRDNLGLRLAGVTGSQPGAIGVDRTPLLALWVGESAGNAWQWAVEHLLDRVQHYARTRHQCGSRPAHFIKLLAENLDPLSLLAGFDPTRSADTWHALPTHTLRFAEVLSKIYASEFSVGEILYLFTANNHLDGDDPFPLPDDNEALDSPLEFPDDEAKYSLWALRRELLAVSIPKEEAERWTWRHIEWSLRHEFGYESAGGADLLLSIGEHFFPHILAACGNHVDTKQRQYRVQLAASSTNATMWNTPDSPFHYDTSAQELWIRLPLMDEEVFEKLSHIRQLNQEEQDAVQSLYFAPRADLAAFAFIFSNFGASVERLVQEGDEEKRWDYFQHEFARCHARSHVISEHLARHVAAATGQEQPAGPDSVRLAWRLLRHLFADENRATGPWETDSGQLSGVTWQPQPHGGAFAALLGLTGTGLLGTLTPEGGGLAWSEVRGPMSAFGHEKNRWNIPVPTILPSMSLTLSPAQARFAGIRNGFAMKGQNGEPLGGPQGFSVRWQGVLLVEHEGMYEFHAGSPTSEGERPDFEAAEERRWRITLKRGQKAWVVLAHHWPNTQAPAAHAAPLALRSGAYQITVEFAQPEVIFTQTETCRQHTGFQVKYCGPDSEDHLVTIPLDRLYRDTQDEPLGSGIDRGGAAGSFLSQHFTSTLRAMRRTYQRAFKALLFAQRFGLSASPITEYGQSEIGYMLTHPDLFEGTSYYRQGQNAGFGTHHAYFNFNLLPLLDNYHPPLPAEDQRVQPSPQRRQALFDWWERIFDYVQMRRETRHVREHPLWLLFEEAIEKQPDNPAQLLRHVGVELDHANLVTRYYQGYTMSSDDLEDERWAIRAWRAEKWTRDLLSDFAVQDIQAARPDLWASDDPNAVLSGETQAGNDNLTRFVRDSCLENGRPRRYEEIRRLNDELRERARRALLAYLCAMNRVPLPWGGYAQKADDLSDLLLLDVEAGICERTTRIEEAISAVQAYIQRCRLGLEAGFTISPAFVQLWESRFVSLRSWEAWKRRALYRENWIDWDELEKVEHTEAFRFLDAELQRTILTIPGPGGMEYWIEQPPPDHAGLALLQRHDPSRIQEFAPPPQPEGLDLLGTPERNARLSWLSMAPQNTTQGDGNPDGGPVILAVNNPPPAQPGQDLPLWIEAAIRLNVRFLRVAAASEPPASATFIPDHRDGEARCCCQCGKVHSAVVDEYYFWLLDSRFYEAQEQDAEWPWEDPGQQPHLLHWDERPMVHLAWCRLHNGEFQQPRRSDEGVPLTVTADHKIAAAQLELVGRAGDSLTFKVDGAAAPLPGYDTQEQPGFRYDLVADTAVTLPLVVAPPAPAIDPGLGGLAAYPYFAYFEPGAPVMPRSLFGQALLVARALRTHCRFEEALKWYALAFNPLVDDCSWCPQEQTVPEEGITEVAAATAREVIAIREDGHSTTGMPCCSSITVSDEVARNRSIMLHYLETLLQWGDALMRHNSPEAFQQARVIFDTAERILGKRPRSVRRREGTDMAGQEPQVVLTFVPECAPLNPRVLDLYELVDDRLALIHNCLNERRLHNGRLGRDMPYWGSDPLRNGWQTMAEADEGEICAIEGEGCCPHSPYRFMFLIQKAQEIANQVREFGASLLAAFEKGDAEYLASLRALHERHLLDLTLEVRQHQWRESDWQVQALQKTLEETQARLNYYTGLIQNGLISNEVQYQALTGTSTAARTAGNVSEGIGQAMNIIPDFWFGEAGFGGSPLSYDQFPLGTKLSGLFSAAARISNTLADIASTTAALDLTQAGWDRRLQEWHYQVQVLTIEIEQIRRQILAAERRRDVALRELNNHRQQMEQSAEVLDFLRDKFTNHALYLFLQQDTAMLYSRMYELALCSARQAQRAFNYERGHTTRHFLPAHIWDNLHEGLLAGERLQLALRRMEKTYLDENVREYELTKHFSLRLHFPWEFLQLKATGCCEIELPEWMFDLDYPGHYMRRIRNVSLTIPCVVGPYTGVHCRLTLLRSMTRVHPRLRDPLIECCDDEECDNGYRPMHHDPRIVTQYTATEAIATSSGQNDAGLFDLNFRDERYLPFEFMGAVCRMRIELPQENNQFDIDSVTDLILHLNYTAREGGEVLRRAANEVARCHLPGSGVRYFDIRHEFPDAWHRFQSSFKQEDAPKHLGIRLSRDMFPFIPGHKELWINRLAIFFEIPEAETGQHKVVEFLVEHRDGPGDGDKDDCDVYAITCVASEEWPHLYHGVLDVRSGPLAQRADRNLGIFSFPTETGVISRAFLLCGYDVKQRHSDEQAPMRKRRPW